jgi:hypothetical protein
MITVICGVAGKGKTALATQLTLKEAAKGRPIFSNYNISWSMFGVPITSFEVKPEYFKEKSFPIDSYVNIDEAQNDFNSRFFKEMTKEEIKYFSGHRHLGIDIVMTTQHPNRIDIVLRENADKFLWIRYALPFGWKICYEYYLADHVGHLPPEVPRDFIKLRIYKVRKTTYTKYDDKYLRHKMSVNFLDQYSHHEYSRSRYIPFPVRAWRSIRSSALYYYQIWQLRKEFHVTFKDKLSKIGIPIANRFFTGRRPDGPAMSDPSGAESYPDRPRNEG